MSNIQQLEVEEKAIPKRQIPKELDMSVFYFPCRWKSFRGFWRNIVHFFDCLRAGWRRATKGFCFSDCWDTDQSITMYVIKVLTEFRNCANGYPTKYFNTFAEWIAYIDEIIDLLIFSLKDPQEDEELCPHYKEWSKICFDADKNDENSMQIKNAYYNEIKNAEQQIDKAREKAFSMLGKYLGYMWW